MTDNHNKVRPAMDTLQTLTAYRKPYARLHSLFLLTRMERVTVGTVTFPQIVGIKTRTSKYGGTIQLTPMVELSKGKVIESLPLSKSLSNKQSPKKDRVNVAIGALPQIEEKYRDAVIPSSNQQSSIVSLGDKGGYQSEASLTKKLVSDLKANKIKLPKMGERTVKPFLKSFIGSRLKRHHLTPLVVKPKRYTSEKLTNLLHWRELTNKLILRELSNLPQWGKLNQTNDFSLQFFIDGVIAKTGENLVIPKTGDNLNSGNLAKIGERLVFRKVPKNPILKLRTGLNNLKVMELFNFLKLRKLESRHNIVETKQVRGVFDNFVINSKGGVL